MDADTYGWKIGISKRKWEDRYYYYDNVKRVEYNDDVQEIYLGAGKKFRRDDNGTAGISLLTGRTLMYNSRMFALFVRIQGLAKRTFSRARFFSWERSTRNNTDPYLSYRRVTSLISTWSMPLRLSEENTATRNIGFRRGIIRLLKDWGSF